MTLDVMLIVMIPVRMLTSLSQVISLKDGSTRREMKHSHKVVLVEIKSCEALKDFPTPYREKRKKVCF